MKRIFVLSLAILLLITLISGGCAKPAPAPTPAPAGKEWVPPVPGMKQGEEDKYFVWTWASPSSRTAPPAPFKRTREEYFWDELEKRTGGRFKVKYAYGGILGSGWETPQLVGAGVCELGGTPPEWHISDFPALTMSCNWGWHTGRLDRDGFALDVKLNESIYTHPLAEANLAKMNLVFAYTNGGQTWKLPVRKGVKEIEKAEDLAGLNCWAVGYPAIWAKALGMTPVSVLPSEFYESMQKGMIDVNPWMVAEVVRFKMDEVCDRVVDVTLGSSCFCGYANKEEWDGLPQYIKDLWWELYPEYYFQYYIDLSMAELQEFFEVCEKKGIRIYKLPPEEEAKVREPMKLMWEPWIVDCEKLPAGQGIREFLKDQIAYRDKLIGGHWDWCDEILGLK